MKNKALEQKKQIVEEITDKLERAQSVVLVDYRGLNVEEVTQLRRNYKEAGVEYKVYKNTLVKRAMDEVGGYDDPVQAAKITHDFAKENKKLEIKAGIVDGKIIDIEEIKNLATLPSKEVLIAQALAGLNGPIAGFANVLQGTIRSLVYALNAIKEKQEGQEA